MPLESNMKNAEKRCFSVAAKLVGRAILWTVAVGWGGCVHAGPNRASQADAWRTECIGYYSVQLPPAIEYGSVEPRSMLTREIGWGFSSGRLPAWGMLLNPDPGITDEDDREQSLYVSRQTTPEVLKALMDELNGDQEREKQVLLDEAQRWLRRNDVTYAAQVQTRAAALRFYKPIPGMSAIADDDGKMATFYVYLNSRIIKARRPSLGSNTKTVEAFLQQYSIREPFALRAEPGACLPYGFYRGEKSPAHVGVTVTPIEQPDVVINVEIRDAALGVKPPKEAIIQQLRFDLLRVVDVKPLDGRMRPSHHVVIDGQEGLGHFALVRREDKPDSSTAKANPYTKDHTDWVYVAYAPGQAGGKPGDSFSIQVRVERFGRFAKEPVGKQMTEKQFREFAKRIVEGIHRRPGAWVANSRGAD
jgi:hypothetical protein